MLKLTSNDGFDFGVLLGILAGITLTILVSTFLEARITEKSVIYDFQTIWVGVVATLSAFMTIWQVRRQMHRRELEIESALKAKQRASQAMLESSGIELRGTLKKVSDILWPLYHKCEAGHDIAKLRSTKTDVGILLSPQHFAVFKESLEFESEERTVLVLRLLNCINRIQHGIWTWDEQVFLRSRVDPNFKIDLAVMLLAAVEAYVRINQLSSGADHRQNLNSNDVYPLVYLLSDRLYHPDAHVELRKQIEERFGPVMSFVNSVESATLVSSTDNSATTLLSCGA